MKQFFVMILLGLSLSLTDCGGSTSEASSNSSNTTAGSAVSINENVNDVTSEAVVDDIVDNASADTNNVDDNNEVVLDEDDKAILADPNNFLTEEDLSQIRQNHEEINKSIEEYRKVKDASVKLNDFQLKGCYITYTGNIGIDAVSKKDGNILYIKDKNNSDELIIGVYDKSVNEAGWQAVIDKNHKHEDSTGNVYYSADALDGGESYYAYEDGTLITFIYETGDIFNNIEIHK